MYKQKGLSLIELMISLTLGIVLMTGVVQMFLTSRTTYSHQQAISRIQEGGRMAVDFLAQDIRMAGYMGCASDNAEITLGLESGDASDDYKYKFSEAIRGYAAADAPGTLTPAADTDVLVIRRASGEGVPIIDEHEQATNANLKVDGEASDKCLVGVGFCANQVGVITDCTKGRVFRAVTISNSGTKPTIAHSKGGGGSVRSNLDNTLGDQGFGKGSRIMALNTIAYYVADSDFSPDGAAPVRSLWKQVGEEAPVELIEGVEDMTIHYGLDIGAPDKVPDTYRAQSDMAGTDWPNVRSVRLYLLLQGAQPNVLPESQTLDFAGEELIFTDGRMRQIFTSTVGIRGRLDN